MGKTHFIVTTLGLLHRMGVSFMVAAPSKSATDNLAEKLNAPFPYMGAIHFHSLDNEARAIRRKEKVHNNNQNGDEKNEQGGQARIHHSAALSETARHSARYAASISDGVLLQRRRSGRP